MKPSVLAAVLALGLAPLVAIAQEADAPQAAATTAAATAHPSAPAAPWSLGAGAGWIAYSTQYVFLGGGSVTPPAAPTVRATLERSVAQAWWLEVGLIGSATRQRGDAPDGTGAITRNDQASASLTLGARRALTRPGAPVCVSIDLALVAGYYVSHVDWAYSTPQTIRSEALSLGLAAGLAVERELTSGLSLRIGTTLASATWAKASVESSLSGRATLDGGGVNLTLSPWLELRQAF